MGATERDIGGRKLLAGNHPIHPATDERFDGGMGSEPAGETLAVANIQPAEPAWRIPQQPPSEEQPARILLPVNGTGDPARSCLGRCAEACRTNTPRSTLHSARFALQ